MPKTRLFHAIVVVGVALAGPARADKSPTESDHPPKKKASTKKKRPPPPPPPPRKHGIELPPRHRIIEDPIGPQARSPGPQTAPNLTRIEAGPGAQNLVPTVKP